MTFASCGGDKAVFYWDVATGKIMRKFIGHFQRVNSVSISPDMTVLASGNYPQIVITVVASYDATVRLWDLKSHNKAPIQILEEAKDSVSSVVMNGHDVLTA